MSKVRVQLCPEMLRSSMVRVKMSGLLEWVKEYQPEYESTHRFTVTGTSIEAAEEVFDITNNPSREEESNDLYGCHRPVSVGDIVIVEEFQADGSFKEVSYLCENIGWTAL